MPIQNNYTQRVPLAPQAEVLDGFFGTLDQVAQPDELYVQTLARNDRWGDASQEHRQKVRKLIEGFTAEIPIDQVTLLRAMWKRERGHVQFSWQWEPNQPYAQVLCSEMQHDQDLARKILVAVASHFRPYDFSGDVSRVLPDAFQAYATAVESSLSKRTKSVDELHNKLIQSQKELVQAATSRMAEIEDLAQKRFAQVETDATQRRNAVEQELAGVRTELAKREQAVVKREAEIERRDPRAVRKQLQEDMRKLLKDHADFTLSPPTAKTRVPVHAAGLSALGLALAFYGYVVWRVLGKGDPTSLQVGLLATSSVFVAILLWFYLRFVASWFKGRAESETGVRALTEDMLRAQWLVEIMFEWRREKEGEPIPWDVLRRLAHGLFERTPVAVGATHPLDDVAGSLPGIRELRVGRRSARVKFSGPGRSTPPPQMPKAHDALS